MAILMVYAAFAPATAGFGVIVAAKPLTLSTSISIVLVEER